VFPAFSLSQFPANADITKLYAALEEWSSGVFVASLFTQSKYFDRYTSTMQNLEHFDNQRPKLLRTLRDRIWVEAMCVCPRFIVSLLILLQYSSRCGDIDEGKDLSAEPLFVTFDEGIEDGDDLGDVSDNQ
jgi:hypothetical protein